MRRGSSFYEILLVIAVVVIIGDTVMPPLFRALLYEIPRGACLVNENIVLLGAVEQMRADVESAKSLPDSFEGRPAGDALVVELADAVVMYELADGGIHRRRIRGAEKRLSDDVFWSLPHGRIHWQAWRREDRNFAVELSTHLLDNDLGHQQKKMANSYVFFVGSDGGNAE
jgi:hypothetical protein